MAKDYLKDFEAKYGLQKSNSSESIDFNGYNTKESEHFSSFMSKYNSQSSPVLENYKLNKDKRKDELNRIKYMENNKGYDKFQKPTTAQQYEMDKNKKLEAEKKRKADKEWYKKIPVVSDFAGGLVYETLAGSGKSFEKATIPEELGKAPTDNSKELQEHLNKKILNFLPTAYQKVGDIIGKIIGDERTTEERITENKEIISSISKNMSDEGKEYINRIETGSKTGDLIANIPSNLARTVGAMSGASMMGRGNTLSGMGINSYGNALIEAEELGIENKDAYATTTALIEVISEQIGGSEALGAIMREGLSRATIKEVVKKIGSGNLNEILWEGAKEGLQEGATELAQMTKDTKFKDRDGNTIFKIPETDDEWSDAIYRVLEAGAVGAVMGSGGEYMGSKYKSQNQNLIEQTEDGNFITADNQTIDKVFIEETARMDNVTVEQAINELNRVAGIEDTQIENNQQNTKETPIIPQADLKQIEPQESKTTNEEVKPEIARAEQAEKVYEEDTLTEEKKVKVKEEPILKNALKTKKFINEKGTESTQYFEGENVKKHMKNFLELNDSIAWNKNKENEDLIAETALKELADEIDFKDNSFSVRREKLKHTDKSKVFELKGKLKDNDFVLYSNESDFGSVINYSINGKYEGSLNLFNFSKTNRIDDFKDKIKEKVKTKEESNNKKKVLTPKKIIKDDLKITEQNNSKTIKEDVKPKIERVKQAEKAYKEKETKKKVLTPKTEDSKKLKEAIDSRFNERYKDNDIKAVTPKRVEQKAIKEKFKDTFNRDVVFYEGQNVPRGFAKSGHIFINSDLKAEQLIQTAMHELFHTTEETKTYKDLLEFAKNNFTEEEINKFLSGFTDNQAQELKNNSDLLFEEMIAESLGFEATNSEFWNRLAEKDSNLFSRVVEIIEKIIKKLKNTFKNDFLMKEHVDKLNDDFINLLKEIENTDSDSGSKFAERDIIKTENFKKWFKDSKVVNKNGEPLLVHHGTQNGYFNAFDKNKAQEGLYGVGFYFTPEYDFAESYTEGYNPISKEKEYTEIRPVGKINIEKTRKLLKEVSDFINSNRIDDYYVEHAINSSLNIDNKEEYEGYKWETDKYFLNAINESLKAETPNLDKFENLLNYYLRQDIIDFIGNSSLDFDVINKDITENEDVFKKVFSVYLSIQDPYYTNRELTAQDTLALKAEGYDGIYVEEEDYWIAFYPEQIKYSLENAGTFDPNNPDIRFAERKYNRLSETAKENIKAINSLKHDVPVEKRKLLGTERYESKKRRIMSDKIHNILKWEYGVNVLFNDLSISQQKKYATKLIELLDRYKPITREYYKDELDMSPAFPGANWFYGKKIKDEDYLGAYSLNKGDIELNAKYRPQELKELFKRSQYSNHNVKNTKYESILTHEVGHAITYQIKAESPEVYKMLEQKADEFMNEDLSIELSQYANKNFDEFIAEAFAEYHDSPRPRRIAREIGSIIDFYYGNTQLHEKLDKADLEAGLNEFVTGKKKITVDNYKTVFDSEIFYHAEKAKEALRNTDIGVLKAIVSDMQKDTTGLYVKDVLNVAERNLSELDSEEKITRFKVLFSEKTKEEQDKIIGDYKNRIFDLAVSSMFNEIRRNYEKGKYEVKFSERDTSKGLKYLNEFLKERDNTQLLKALNKTSSKARFEDEIDLHKLLKDNTESIIKDNSPLKDKKRKLTIKLKKQGFTKEQASDLSKWIVDIISKANELEYVDYIEDTFSQNFKSSSKKNPTDKDTIELLFKTNILDDIAPIREYCDEEIAQLASLTTTAGGRADAIIMHRLADMDLNFVNVSLKELLEKNEPKGKEKIDFYKYAMHKQNIFTEPLDKPSAYKTEDIAFNALESKKITEQYEKKYPHFKESLENIVNWVGDLTQNYAVNTGLITQEAFNQWKAENPFYLPKYKEVDELEHFSNLSGNSRNFLDRTTPIKNFKGSNLDLIDIGENLIYLTHKLVKTSMFNNVGQAMFDKAEDAEIEGDTNLKFSLSDEYNSHKDNVFEILVNGEKQYIEVHNNLLKDSLKGITKPNYNDFELFVRNYFTKYWKAGITTYNPMFAIRNVSRDSGEFVIYSQEEIARNVIKNYLLSTKQVFSKKDSEMMDKFLSSGVMSSSLSQHDRSKAINDIRKQKQVFDENNNVIDFRDITYWERKGDELLKGLEYLPEKSEMIPRYAEFAYVLEKTGNTALAIEAAKDVTVNFAQGGKFIKHIDSFVPLTNAGVQGLYKGYREYRNNPRKVISKGLKILTIPTVAIALMYRDDEDYKALNQRTKDNNYLFKIGDGKFIKIPKSRTNAIIFSTLFERIIQGNFEGYGDYIAESIAPNNFITDGIANPISRIAFGGDDAKDWAGRYIIPSRLKGIKQTEQYDETTTYLSIALSKVLNALSKDIIKISPIKADYIIKSYTGFVGEYLMPIMNKKGIETLKNNGIGYILEPGKRSFVADGVYSNADLEQFYKNKEELEKEVKTDKAITAREDKTYSKSKKDTDLKQFNKVQEEISELYKKYDTAKTDDERREIKKKINELAKTQNKRYLPPKK